MTITGTSSFVSVNHAIAYYREQTPGCTSLEATKLVAEKIQSADIHIGRPILKPGERLTLLDGGRRYGIVSAS